METATHEIKKNAGALVTVRISADKLSADITVTPGLAVRADAIEIVKTELQRLKVVATLDVDTLASAIRQVSASGECAVGVVIARGIAPTPPVDARIEWTKEFFASGYYVDPETKCTDYHRKAATPSIDEGEVIAVCHPAQPGTDGQDVLGSNVAPAKPKPREHNAGQNVSFDETTGQFRAKCNGRVKLDGRVINVVDVYQLPGAVGIASGNVDHRGSVVINGGVDSEFKVTATGDVEVRDVIGAADIECGGNLTAGKGISSGPGKKINVKGNIHAKYLEHATITCDGDVVVETEILDSSVKAAGKVICAGRVQGGDVMAANGIEIDEAGAHTESRTTLIAGIDYRVVNDLRGANESAKKLKEIIPKLEIEVKKLERLGSHLTATQRETMTELAFKLFEQKAAYDELTEKRKLLAVQMQSHRDATIVLRKRVNSGTMLRICEAHKEVRDDLLGPITAGLDPVTKQIILTS